MLGIHRRLLGDGATLGWIPYIWLPYLCFLFIGWFYGPVGAIEIVGTLAAVGLFLAMYFRSYSARPREMPWLIAGTAGIGLALTPFNFGAEVFLIYAAAMCGYVGHGARVAFAFLVVVIAAQVGELLLLDLPVGQWLWGPLVAFSVGLGNLYFSERSHKNQLIKQSQEEIRRLATTAERERIARDLHDLLGHTLTLITVKAELAGALAERDLPGAAKEIRELEQIARDALAQVRRAVGGYRSDLAGEIANAGVTLRAANVAFEANTASGGGCGKEQDAALAMVVREAVTNIVRHAGARTCRLSLEHDALGTTLDIRDDGVGGRRKAGNGIRGMRERLEELGGTLSVEFDANGTSLHAAVPARKPESDAPSPQPETGSAVQGNEKLSA